MLVLWPDTADVLRDMIRQYGLDPNRVDSPESAWPAFWAFLAIDVDGLARDGREDGFEVSWGRAGWSDDRPSISFVRQLAVDASTGPSGSPAPEHWKLSLDMVFAEHAALADVAELNAQSSGVYHARPGPEMNHALTEVLCEVERFPTLQMLWRRTPLWSAVSFGPRGIRTRPVETFDTQQRAAYLAWRAEHG